ncbi:MAG: hypothetical protein F2923_08900 [Actinobacteria bacterium]|uniref:Unannotated protein n=1 Tax=freshwater metagenome TaxID=449393 RepID=A0A6J7SSE6_9ZZZZ|nr:hypothetical protein [Actinomycetota bacterium]
MNHDWLTSATARPRYRPECPLLWRGLDQVQLGEGRRHVLIQASPLMARWILGLSGLRTVDELLGDLTVIGLDQDTAMHTLRVCEGAGAIDDAASMPNSWRHFDSAARQQSEPDHTAALLTYGHSTIAHSLIDQRNKTTAHVKPALNQRADPHLITSIHFALAAAGLTLTDDAQRPDLTVIVGSHPVIGSEISDLEIPTPTSAHLFVASYGDRAIAGPLVIPGNTSCLRCAYLHTRDADHQWAGVSLQLTSAIARLRQLPVDRLLATLIAAQVGRLARAWADHTIVQTQWQNLAFELRLPECEVTIQPRPSHPLCQCRWTTQADLTM